MDENYNGKMVEFFEGRLKETYFETLKTYNSKQVNNLIDELKKHYDKNDKQYEDLSLYKRELKEVSDKSFSDLEKILQEIALIEFELTQNPEYSLTKDELNEIEKDL